MRRAPVQLRHLLTLLLTAATVVVAAAPAHATSRLEVFNGAVGTEPVPDLAIGGNGALWGAQPGAGGGLRQHTLGAGGTLWTPAGLTPAAEPRWLTAGEDGNTWFTEGFAGAARIGRMTETGETTIFTDGVATGGYGQLAPGPDGNLWFTHQSGDLGHITPTGQITTFSATGTDEPITAGSDGALWFLASGDRVGRISPSGTIMYFALTGLASLEDPEAITTGADGNLWIVATRSIVRLTPTGQATRFVGDLGTDVELREATLGPDGNVWFAGAGCDVGRITPAGAITRFPGGHGGCHTIRAISGGPDGNLWWAGTRPAGDNAESHVNVVARLQAIWEPTASMAKAPPVTEATASLSGTVVAEGSPTTAHVEWGPSTNFGTSEPAIQADGFEPTPIAAQLSGLQPGTRYFARIVSTNALGTTTSETVEFQLPPAPEVILTPVAPPGGSTLGPLYPGPDTPSGKTSVPASGRALAVSLGGVVRLPLTCRGAACSATLTLTGKLAKGRPSAVMARKTVTINANTSTRAGLRITAAGRKAIRKAGRKGLSAIVTVAVGTTTTRYRVRLKP